MKDLKVRFYNFRDIVDPKNVFLKFLMPKGLLKKFLQDFSFVLKPKNGRRSLQQSPKYVSILGICPKVCSIIFISRVRWNYACK